MPSFGRQHTLWQAYGGWTFALKDYYALNFTAQLDDPGTRKIWEVVDGYIYFDRLEALPKFVVNACGDEFLQMDDDHYVGHTTHHVHTPIRPDCVLHKAPPSVCAFWLIRWYPTVTHARCPCPLLEQWWDALKGEKHRLIIQDAEHSLATGLEQVVPSLSSFITAVFHDIERPMITWELGTTATGNNITMFSATKPDHVRVWHADTLQDKRRDWRLLTGETPCPTKAVDGACFQPVRAPTLFLSNAWTAYRSI